MMAVVEALTSVAMLRSAVEREVTEGRLAPENFTRFDM
jgi:hypothetical protein